MAAHFNRQLKQGRRVSILPLSLAFAALLFFLFFNTYNLIEQGIIWTLPLWLMLFSLVYCAVWIGRIVSLLARQARAGVMEEIGLIPPGRTYVFLVIGKIVLNEGEALAWLTMLRRYLAGMVFVCLCVALFVTAAQIGAIDLLELGVFLAALALMTLVIPLEHEQSVVLGFLTAILVSTRVRSHIDSASIAIVSFALLQILSYSLAIAVIIALDLADLALMLVLFLRR